MAAIVENKPHRTSGKMAQGNGLGPFDPGRPRVPETMGKKANRDRSFKLRDVGERQSVTSPGLRAGINE